MTHVRQQIRDAAASALAPVGPTVYTMRRYALDDSALPAICVYTTDEQSRPATLSAKTLRRMLSLVVEVVALDASSSIHDTLDGYCAEIEAILGSGAGITAIKDCTLASTETSIDTSGTKPVGVATLTFEVLYNTTDTNAEVAR